MKGIQWIDQLIIKRRYMKRRKEVPNPIRDWPVNVVSRDMGCDRGKTADRFYIEKFLKDHKHYITGNVMEIGNNGYTIQYGENVKNSYVFTANKETKECGQSQVILGDLANDEEGGKNNYLDCFILTQTLPFIYDIRSAASNIVKMLKKGGVALITVSGITMVSRYDDLRWGHYWGFTETSLKKLFENLVPEDQMEIFSFGNPKTAVSVLYGLSVEDLRPEDLEINDDLVPVIIAAVIHK